MGICHIFVALSLFLLCRTQFFFYFPTWRGRERDREIPVALLCSVSCRFMSCRFVSPSSFFPITRTVLCWFSHALLSLYFLCSSPLLSLVFFCLLLSSLVFCLSLVFSFLLSSLVFVPDLCFLTPRSSLLPFVVSCLLLSLVFSCLLSSLVFCLLLSLISCVLLSLVFSCLCS